MRIFLNEWEEIYFYKLIYIEKYERKQKITRKILRSVEA